MKIMTDETPQRSVNVGDFFKMGESTYLVAETADYKYTYVNLDAFIVVALAFDSLKDLNYHLQHQKVSVVFDGESSTLNLGASNHLIKQ